MLKYLLLFSFLISGCSLDLKTKDLVNENIKDQSITIVENYLNFTYVENHAIAFGMFKNLDRKYRMPLIFFLPILTTLFGFYLIWKLKDAKFRILLPIFLIIGGAYGNILDRAMNGYVTDFLHVHYFHKYNFYVFNVADVLVNVGVILLLLQFKEFNNLINKAFGEEESTAVPEQAKSQ